MSLKAPFGKPWKYWWLKLLRDLNRPEHHWNGYKYKQRRRRSKKW